MGGERFFALAIQTPVVSKTTGVFPYFRPFGQE